MAIAAALLVTASASSWAQNAKPKAALLQDATRLQNEFLELRSQGRFDEAIPVAERAVKHFQEALGPEHRDVSLALTGLAGIYLDKHDYAKALLLCERVLAIQEKALGPWHPDVASMLNIVAEVYLAKGDYAQADQLYQRALATWEKIGSDPLGVATSLHGLAYLDQVQGYYREAEALYQRALAIRKQALGPTDPIVAESLGGLARLYKASGNDAKAEPLYRSALAIWEKALGPEDPAVATSLNELADLYRERGDHAKAEPLYQRALTILQKAGPEHPDVATLLNGLGALYQARRDYVKAEALYERGLAILEKALGPEHRSVLFSLSALAMLCLEKGDYAKMEPLVERMLTISEKEMGAEFSGVADLLKILATIYANRGDHARAESLMRRALSIREKVLGREHPETIESISDLAAYYLTKGDYARAEELRQRMMPTLISAKDRQSLDSAEQLLAKGEKALGATHPDVVELATKMATRYMFLGQYHKADALCARVLAMTDGASDPPHIQVVHAFKRLAMMYMAKRDSVRAVSLLQRAMNIWEKKFGAKHPGVATLLSELTILYMQQGDAAKAVQTRERASAIEDRHASVLLNSLSDEQKRAYMATFRLKTNIDITLHVQYAPQSEDSKRLALTSVLRRKTRVLDATADSLAALRRRMRVEDRALLDELRSITAQYSNLAWRGRREMRIEQYHATLSELDAKRQGIEAKVSRRSSELQAELQPITLDRVRAAIPQGAALVEVVRYKPFDATPRPESSIPEGTAPVDWIRDGPSLGPAMFHKMWRKPRYVAYVLRREGRIAWVDLGEAAPIDAAVQKLRAAFGDPDLTHDPKPAARALDALVMQPVRRLLGNTRWLFLSPDAALNLVPLSALVDEEGRYLVERYLITYLSSGRDLLRFQASPAPRQGPLVLAAPAFDGNESNPPDSDEKSHRGLRSVDMSRIRFSSLPSTADEARAIRERLPAAEILVGAQATEGAIKAARGPRILHVATHGFFLPEQDDDKDIPLPFELPAGSGVAPSAPSIASLQYENPLLRSGVGLAGANARASGTDDDGILTALEMSSLDLYGTKLVVLSACETGIGTARAGEGVYGLRRSLAIAGAETQVMSLWKVDTGVTRELMVAYYDKLERGAGRSEAMRQVQLEMLAQPNRAHPNLWASFIVSGNPAALDGSFVGPEVLKVPPRPPGCACEVAGHAGESRGADAPGLSVLAIFATARWRRRRGTCRKR